MKILYILILVFGLVKTSFSQDYSIIYGQILPRELDMIQYPEDTTAPAAVLYELGELSFYMDKIDLKIFLEVSKKIKIFTKAGFEYAQIEIPVYNNKDYFEEVENIEAFTYNRRTNGTIYKTQLEKKNIFIEKKSENWKLVKFTMPEVHEGSVIEFKYTIKTPRAFGLRDWYFQSEIPVNYSHYVAKTSIFETYAIILQGVDLKKCYKTYDDKENERKFGSYTFYDKVHDFTAKNIPAFYDEKYIASKEDYIKKVHFQLAEIIKSNGVTEKIITTWPELCNRIMKHEKFGKYIKACEKKATNVLDELNLNNLSQKEKVNSIITYLKTNYKWNGEDHFLAKQTINEFYDSKSGNSANINLFLIALLNKADINVLPVILSTREHGKIKADYPFYDFFNYVAVLIELDGSLMLTDATEPLLPYYLIPPKCINERGLVVQKNSDQFIELANLTPSITEHNINVEFTKNLDSLKGTFNYSTNLYDAYYLRKLINDKDENKVNFVENKSYTLTREIKTTNFYATEKPYYFSFVASTPVESFHNKLVINPFFNEGYKENPFNTNTRLYPIDFIYTQKKAYNISIKIPANTKISYFPPDINIDNEEYSFHYKAEINDESIRIKSDYFIKKPVYQPKEYEGLKSFFTEMVKTMNDKLVFEKISE